MGGSRTGYALGLGPVFSYEWITSSRRWQGYALRSLFVGALLAALIVVWSGRLRGLITPTIRALAELGELFFKAVVGTQLVLVLLAAPALTAGAICLERARGTLTHLMVTDLSAAEIVLGKLAARLVPVLSMVVCAFPVMMLLTLLGGVDSGALAGALLVTLGIAGLGSALALALSLWAEKTHEALLGTYAVWGVWLLGPSMLTLLGTQVGMVPWIPLRNTDPFLLAFAPYTAPGSVSWGDYLWFLGGTWMIAAGLATLAVNRLRPVCTCDSTRWKNGRVSRWSGGQAYLGRLVRLERWVPAPSLDFNPVLWREWHRNKLSLKARIGAALFLILAVTCSAVVVAAGTRSGTLVVNAFQVSIGLLLISVTAASSLAEERARGSLDILMATPMSTRQIVLGKWLGSFRLVPALAVLPTLVVIAEAGWDSRKLSMAILMPAYVIAVGAAITSLGVAMATWCSRLGRSIGLSVMIYVLVTVGWMFLVMALMRPHPYGFAFIAGSPFFGPIVITSQLESLRIEWGDVVAVTLWVGAYAAASIVLLSATIATFDRFLGRITSRSLEQGSRDPEPVDLVTAESVRGPESTP